MDLDVTLRLLQVGEGGALRPYLYLAVHVPPGAEPPPESIVDDPGLALYVEGWGRDGDVAIVAGRAGRLVGAAWARLWPGDVRGYGFVDASTPEVSMSVRPEARGRGVGTELLEQLLRELQRQGCLQASLSVQRSNPALRLYERSGFFVHADHGEEVVMGATLGAAEIIDPTLTCG